MISCVHKETLVCGLLAILLLLLSGHENFAQTTGTPINGTAKFYHENGVLSSTGQMVDGRPEGLWKNYYDTGILKSEGTRNNEALEGIWKFYNAEGVLVEEISYGEGKRDGVTRKYNQEGFLEAEIPYQNGVKQGMAVTYFKDGRVKTETPYVQGEIDGQVYTFNSDGEISSVATYKNGIFIKQASINKRNERGEKEGEWREFYEDRSIKTEGKYVNGNPDGYWKSYTKSGELESTQKFDRGKEILDADELANLTIEEKYYQDSDGKIKFRGTFKDKLAHGTHIWYALSGEIDSAKVYKNGKPVASGNLSKNGLKIGEWEEYYYPEGNLKARGGYEKGYKVGLWEVYNMDGNLEQKGAYSTEGKPDGTWKWYYPNGQLMREESFKNGVEHGWLKEYSDEGKLMTEGEYKFGKEEGEWVYEVGDHQEIGEYQDGLRQGIWKHFYLSNGKLRFEGEFFDDDPTGIHTWYYDTGVKMLEGGYVSGIQEGEWRRYYEDGTIFVAIEYNSGQEIKVDGIKIKLN